MSSDITPVDGMSAADATPVSGRSTADIRTAKKRGLDRRTKLARRAKQLARALEAELGDELSDARKAAVWRAAELLTIAADLRSRWMARDLTVSSTDIVRVEGTARRALVDLDLPATSGVRPAESLEDYWARTTDDTEGDQDVAADEIEGDDLAAGQETP
jgi:hypothetical protein